MSAREEAVDLVLESIKDMRKSNLYGHEVGDFEAVCDELALIRQIVIDWQEGGGTATRSQEREVLTGAAFGTLIEPGGMLQRATEDVTREQAGIVRILQAKTDEMPHMGALAEALCFRRLCVFTAARHMEGKTWAEALGRTREDALGLLMAPEVNADAWERAYAGSQRAAAGRFLRQTEYLTRLQTEKEEP